jgi:hypothetical protein
MSSVPSENILKLRELTERMHKEIKEDEYKVIVKQLKKIVDDGKGEIAKSDCSESKIKCYENMCSTITSILTNVKFK